MTETDFLLQLGARIRKIRIEKQISQFELASLCDFEKASMSRIESGKTNTTVLTLRKIGNALGVEVNEFFVDGKDGLDGKYKLDGRDGLDGKYKLDGKDGLDGKHNAGKKYKLNGKDGKTK